MFQQGQKVRDILGKVHTVWYVTDCQVVFSNGDWVHPSKVWAA